MLRCSTSQIFRPQLKIIIMFLMSLWMCGGPLSSYQNISLQLLLMMWTKPLLTVFTWTRCLNIINVWKVDLCDSDACRRPTPSHFPGLLVSKSCLQESLTIWNGLSQQATKWSLQSKQTATLMTSHKTISTCVNGLESHMTAFRCCWLRVEM